MHKKKLNKKSVRMKMLLCTYVHNNNINEMTRIPEITTEELRTAINKLRKNKSPDSNGIRRSRIVRSRIGRSRAVSKRDGVE